MADPDDARRVADCLPEAPLNRPYLTRPKERASWLRSGDWYVAAMLSGGIWVLAQFVVPLPGSLGAWAMAIVVIQAIVVALVAPGGAFGSRWLRPLLLLTLVTACLPAIRAVFNGVSPPEVFADLVFMWGAGVGLLACLLYVPRVRGTWLLRSVIGVLLGIGVVQIISQDLLIAEEARASLGVVYEYFSNNMLRASSVMSSAARFGEVAAAIALIALAKMLRGGVRFATLTVLIIALFCLANTYSRASYIVFLVGGILVVLMTWVTYWRRRIPVPIALLALVGFVAILFLGFWVPTTGALDDTSLVARVAHWQAVADRVAHFDITDWLVGSSTTARFPINDPQYFVLDNVYLAHFMYGGIIGLAVFIGLVLTIIGLALRVAHRVGGTIIPLTSFYIALLCSGLFLDNHNSVNVAAFALLGAIGAVMPTNRTDGHADQLIQGAHRNRV